MILESENSQVVALAASEYPISFDALVPTINSGQNEYDSAPNLDLQATPSIIRHNSIHRYTLSTRTIAHYCRLEQVGEGTYGQVYRAKCLTSTLSHPKGGEMVALKKIRLHHPGYWGIPPTVIREIKILKKLQHKNMVKMYEVVSSKGVEELDWEDEWEDEKRRKELKSNNNNNSTPPLAHPENIDCLLNANVDKTSSKNDDRKNVSMQISSHSDSAKKKKKDSMTDVEKLRESYKGNLFLVLEYISHDLTGLLDMANKFTEVQTKSIIKQLLEVLEFMHLRNFVHRDLKSSNVLITDKYEVKLADFGLARCLESSFIGRVGSNESCNSKVGEFTNKVITLWYRPPELLLGETKYGTAVDIWSAGCILAEIILGRPIFTGKTDIDQLKLIFDLIGTPNERSWEGFGELKLIRTGEVTIDKAKRPKLRDKYGSRIQPTTAMSLLEKLLELDPKKRLTATRALHHRYFQTDPLAPDDPKDLGTINLGGDKSGYHEFQTKKRRREAKAAAKSAEEEAKIRGEAVEKQKEAFDKAYRGHLKKWASADRRKEETELQLQGRKQEPCPWEDYQEQQHNDIALNQQAAVVDGHAHRPPSKVGPCSNFGDIRQRPPGQPIPNCSFEEIAHHSCEGSNVKNFNEHGEKDDEVHDEFLGQHVLPYYDNDYVGGVKSPNRADDHEHREKIVTSQKNESHGTDEKNTETYWPKVRVKERSCDREQSRQQYSSCDHYPSFVHQLSQHYTIEKRKLSLDCSSLIVLQSNERSSRSSSSFTKVSEGQPREIHDTAMLRQSSLDRDDDQPCKRSRYHNGRLRNLCGASVKLKDVDVSRGEPKLSSQVEGHPKLSVDRSGRTIRSRCDLPVHSSGRQYERYGNPIGGAPSSRPSGLDRDHNMRSPDWFKQRDRDRGGNSFSQRSSRKLDQGPPRGAGGDAWPSKQGRHRG